jgi:protein-disulfide isomerase
MAKVAPRRPPVRKERQTNWYLLGGLIALGVIGLFALLFLSLQGGATPASPDRPVERVLEGYCERNPDRCMVRGDSSAPVTIVEVSDYGCSHCRNFNMSTAGVLDETYVGTGEVRWISLPYALSTATLPAAESSMCAAEQEAYWEYHHALFEQQSSELALTRAGFLQAADEVGLDVEAFASCLDSGNYTSIVQNNMTAAQQAGVTGTPTFFVNGVTLNGNRPLSDFQNAIGAAQES